MRLIDMFTKLDNSELPEMPTAALVMLQAGLKNMLISRGITANRVEYTHFFGGDADAVRDLLVAFESLARHLLAHTKPTLDEDKYLTEAANYIIEGELEVDYSSAVVMPIKDGAWVQTWLFVPDPDLDLFTLGDDAAQAALEADIEERQARALDLLDQIAAHEDGLVPHPYML